MRVVDVCMQRAQALVSLKMSDRKSIKSIKPEEQGAIILKHVLLEQDYALPDKLIKLVERVGDKYETELRHKFKSWFIKSDEL